MPASRRSLARARFDKAAPALGDGTVVIAYLREPREQGWGLLLKLETAGVWLRAIELDSFEAWAREVARGEGGYLGLSTFFVPLHRVEKLVADQRSGPVPSLAERFEEITGRPAGEVLANL